MNTASKNIGENLETSLFSPSVVPVSPVLSLSVVPVLGSAGGPIVSSTFAVDPVLGFRFCKVVPVVPVVPKVPVVPVLPVVWQESSVRVRTE